MSTRTSRQTFICSQRTLLHHRGTLLDMDKRLASLFVTQRDAGMVFAMCDDLMTPHRLRVHRDAIATVADFDVAAVIADPDLLARIRPRHGVAAAVPRNVRVARPFPLLIIHIWIGWAPVENGLHGELILIPTNQHLFVCCAMNPPVGHLCYPAPQLGIKIREIRRLASL